MRDHAQEHNYHAGPVISGRAWSAAPCAGPAAVMLSNCPRTVCAVSAGPGIAARFGRRGPAARRGTGSACPGAVCPGTGSAWAAIRGGDRSGAAVLDLDRAGDLPRLPFRRGTGARIGAGKSPRAWRYRATDFSQRNRWMQGPRALTGSKYFPAITIDPVGLTNKYQQ